MAKSDYQEQILDCLSENLFGLTITDIANKLDISRNTVYRYLGILEAENKVYNKKVGSYTLYYGASQKILSKSRMISFFKGLLENLKKVYPNQEKVFKLIGRNIADSMELPTTKEGEAALKTLEEMTEVEVIKSIGDYIPYFNILHDTIIVSKVEYDENQKKAVITFFNSDMLESTDDYIYYFYLLMGLIEKKISEYIGKEIQLDILEYETFDKKENSFLKMSIDIHLILPQIPSIESAYQSIPTLEELDIKLIKTKIHPKILSYILGLIFLKKKIVFTGILPEIQKHLNTFLQVIFKDLFEFDILFVDSARKYVDEPNCLIIDVLTDHESKKKDYEMVVNKAETLTRDKSMKVEMKIVQRFMKETNNKIALIKLNDEITKCYELSKSLAENISKLLRNDKEFQVDSKIIIDDLIQKYDMKISLTYLRFLIDIVENYYKIDIPELWKFYMFL